jgi:hypothetical protein
MVMWTKMVGDYFTNKYYNALLVKRGSELWWRPTHQQYDRCINDREKQLVNLVAFSFIGIPYG